MGSGQIGFDQFPGIYPSATHSKGCAFGMDDLCRKQFSKTHDQIGCVETDFPDEVDPVADAFQFIEKSGNLALNLVLKIGRNELVYDFRVTGFKFPDEFFVFFVPGSGESPNLN